MLTTPYIEETRPALPARVFHRLVLRYTRFRARLRILWRLTKQSKLRVKIAVIALICFTVSPLELIPDIIPVIGLLDEAIAVGITVWYVKRHDPAVARAITHLFR